MFSYPNPSLLKTPRKNDYLCREVFKKSAGSLKSHAFSVLGQKPITTLFPIRKRQRISSGTLA